MCEFHDCNCNGLGDIRWTDKCMYFSSIEDRVKVDISNKENDRLKYVEKWKYLGPTINEKGGC